MLSKFPFQYCFTVEVVLLLCDSEADFHILPSETRAMQVTEMGCS